MVSIVIKIIFDVLILLLNIRIVDDFHDYYNLMVIATVIAMKKNILLFLGNNRLTIDYK